MNIDCSNEQIALCSSKNQNHKHKKENFDSTEIAKRLGTFHLLFNLTSLVSFPSYFIKLYAIRIVYLTSSNFTSLLYLLSNSQEKVTVDTNLNTVCNL